MLKERKFTARLSLKLLSYALNNVKENCDSFVENGGLGPLFTLFMKRNILSKTDSEIAEDDEHVLSVVHSLTKHCSVGNCQGEKY